MQRKAAIVLALLFLTALASPVFAATQAVVAVFDLDTAGFPEVSAWVQAWNGQGQFIGGLRAEDVAVKEDGQPRPVVQWREERPGAQVVVAIEPGRALGVRDALGVSRYEYIYNQVRSWADSEQEAIYDISLYAADGVEAAHLADFAPFVQALDAYQPQTTAQEVGLKALAEGLRLASDPTPRPGMGRVVLWITPLPSEDAVANLGQYLALAQQSRVRVNVWLVGAPEIAETPQAKAIREFAEATLGQMVVFSSEETLPVLHDLFEPLTRVYRLTYSSAAFQGQRHTVEVTLHTPEGDFAAEAVSFDFALQPPAPVILNPPEQIVRTLPAGETDPARRQPTTQVVQVGVAFPDEHPRDLARVTLLVDGQPEDVRNAPPYDTLSWDLTPYLHSGAHTLQVEAEDVYGLIGRSQPVTVQVSVPRPQSSLASAFSLYRTPLTIGVVALAGVVLLFVLVVGGRRRVKPAAVDLAVAPEASPAGRSHSVRGWWAQRLSRRKATRDAAPLAYLVPLPAAQPVVEDPQEISREPLVIRAADIALGSDPAQADIVIDDPSVEASHARLWRTDEGAFFIADQRSTAGTWLNYAPVSPEGARLQDGDLIHLGRAGFRFRLDLKDEAKIVVRTLS